MARAPASNVFERWTPVWHVLFYVMIAIATFFTFRNFAEEGKGTPVLAVLLAGLLVVWHFFMLVRFRMHREHPKRVTLYLAGAIAISVALLRLSPVFLMVAMTLYNQVFAFLVMRWAIAVAAVLTASITLVLVGRADPAILTVMAIGSGCALLFSLFISATTDESEKRQALIEELERTRVELAFAERLAGRTEERHRIGRELHDTVTQQLVGIVMHLEAANEKGSDPRAAVDSSLRLARAGLAEARRLVWAERPAQLENASLSSALEELIAKEASLEIERDISADIDELPAALQTLVLRGVQESLANIRKHASAKRVAISISLAPDLLAIDVNDDGVGFDGKISDAPSPKNSGFGLRGLRERVVAVGGTLSIESERGSGTTVTVHVPLSKERG